MQPLIRSFIAIQLTAGIHTGLADFTARYNLDRRNGFRPVKPQNIHLTLKFLGDATPDQLTGVKVALEKITTCAKPFHISIQAVGAFPGWERPRSIWAGVQAPDLLQTLYAQIYNATEALGFESESRRFTPHLTLARIASTPPGESTMQVLRTLRNLSPMPTFGEMDVSAVTLFKSTLQPEGPIYTQLSIHQFQS